MKVIPSLIEADDYDVYWLLRSKVLKLPAVPASNWHTQGHVTPTVHTLHGREKNNILSNAHTRSSTWWGWISRLHQP